MPENEYLERPVTFSDQDGHDYVLDKKHGEGQSYEKYGQLNPPEGYVGTVFLSQREAKQVLRQTRDLDKTEKTLTLIELQEGRPFRVVDDLNDVNDISNLRVIAAGGNIQYVVKCMPEVGAIAFCIADEGRFIHSSPISEVSDETYVTQIRAQKRLAQME